MLKNNKFIVLEGIEGSGKTSACNIIKKIFYKQKIKNFIFVRQPGGTKLSEKIRKIIKNKNKNYKLKKDEEILLLYAARINLINTIIKPALREGKWVISDRHDLSTLAYQGEGNIKLEKKIKKIKKIILKSFSENLTIYFDVIPEIGLNRARKRGILDRIESRTMEYFHRVRNSYLQLIKKIKHLIFIDANKDKKKVEKQLIIKFTTWLKKNYDNTKVEPKDL